MLYVNLQEILVNDISVLKKFRGRGQVGKTNPISSHKVVRSAYKTIKELFNQTKNN